jgi:hypothetical protein
VAVAIKANFIIYELRNCERLLKIMAAKRPSVPNFVFDLSTQNSAQ